MTSSICGILLGEILATIPIKASPEFVDSLNAVRLREEEMVEAIQLTIETADSGECYMRCITSAMQLFPAAPHKAQSVVLRLQALALMMERDELKEWMQPGGASFTCAGQKAVIAAVTCHPLSIADGDIVFERESFLKRVLQSAESFGKLIS